MSWVHVSGWRIPGPKQGREFHYQAGHWLHNLRKHPHSHLPTHVTLNGSHCFPHKLLGLLDHLTPRFCLLRIVLLMILWAYWLTGSFKNHKCWTGHFYIHGHRKFTLLSIHFWNPSQSILVKMLVSLDTNWIHECVFLKDLSKRSE